MAQAIHVQEHRISSRTEFSWHWAITFLQQCTTTAYSMGSDLYKLKTSKILLRYFPNVFLLTAETPAWVRLFLRAFGSLAGH